MEPLDLSQKTDMTREGSAPAEDSVEHESAQQYPDDPAKEYWCNRLVDK